MRNAGGMRLTLRGLSYPLRASYAVGNRTRAMIQAAKAVDHRFVRLTHYHLLEQSSLIKVFFASHHGNSAAELIDAKRLQGCAGRSLTGVARTSAITDLGRRGFWCEDSTVTAPAPSTVF